MIPKIAQKIQTYLAAPRQQLNKAMRKIPKFSWTACLTESYFFLWGSRAWLSSSLKYWPCSNPYFWWYGWWVGVQEYTCRS